MKKLLAICTAALLMAPFLARALDDASRKDPLDYPLRQYAFLLAVAMFGGVVSFYNKVKNGSVHAWSMMHLIGELTTSAFAGLIAFWLCAFADTPPLIMAAIVGITGHMGARAIAQVEVWAIKHFTQKRRDRDSQDHES